MELITIHDEVRPGRTVYHNDENPVVKCLRLKGQDATDCLKQELETGLDFESCCYGITLAAYLGNYEVVETFIKFVDEVR